MLEDWKVKLRKSSENKTDKEVFLEMLQAIFISQLLVDFIDLWFQMA